jgi:predicted site-specific integrase-resolvase
MPSTNGHGPKRAILYARVSTQEQARSGYSLAQQIEALQEQAEGLLAHARRAARQARRSGRNP